MANKQVRVIGEISRFGFDWVLTCERCGREAAFDGFALVAYFVAQGWSQNMPIDTSRFRCICGARGGAASLVMRTFRPDPMPPPPVTLAPLYIRRPSALEVIRAAGKVAANRQAQSAELGAALERLAAHVEEIALREFWIAAGDAEHDVRPQRCRAALREITRQLKART